MWPRVRNDRLFAALLISVAALAWISLWLWGRSPYRRFLEHDALGELTGGDAALLLFFVAGWTLMVFAMMLPTSLPLIALFHRMVAGRSHRFRLVSLLVLGYLAVWVGFGAVVHVADLVLHQVLFKTALLDGNGQAIAAVILVLAGVYQFTPLKYHCLDKCRSPFTFIAGHWPGEGDARRALSLGLHHGVYCLGCCWSLMLVMFAVGSGSIGWMLALGAIMAAEKNLPWGRRIGRPLGAGLVAAGLMTALVPTLTGNGGFTEGLWP